MIRIFSNPPAPDMLAGTPFSSEAMPEAEAARMTFEWLRRELDNRISNLETSLRARAKQQALLQAEYHFAPQKVPDEVVQKILRIWNSEA